MPAVPSPPSVMAAGARDTSSDNQQSSKLTTAPARETLASMKNKEAAFYGMDSEEFTDRVTSIMTDYVEGAMQDVKRDFCRAMAAGRGGVRGKHGGDGKEAGAVYESHVAPRVQQLIDRFSKRVDRRADAFEIYLARNIFKVPEGTRESAGQEAMETDAEDQEGEGEGEEPSPPLPTDLVTPEAEEGVDAALTEVRVQIRTLRRQRKAVETLLAKATADVELTQKEAYAVRLRFLQTLNMHPKLGPLPEALETLHGQMGEVEELLKEADVLLPALTERQRREEGGEDMETESSSRRDTRSSTRKGKESSNAPGLSDIRTNTKEDLTALIGLLRPGSRA